MGFLANCSPTLRGAIDDFTKFLPIRVSFGRLNLIPIETYTECRMIVAYHANPDVYRMITEAFAVSLSLLIEQVLGEAFTSGIVKLDYAKPA